jgi:hypothetical protein
VLVHVAAADQPPGSTGKEHWSKEDIAQRARRQAEAFGKQRPAMDRLWRATREMLAALNEAGTLPLVLGVEQDGGQRETRFTIPAPGPDGVVHFDVSCVPERAADDALADARSALGFLRLAAAVTFSRLDHCYRFALQQPPTGKQGSRRDVAGDLVHEFLDEMGVSTRTGRTIGMTAGAVRAKRSKRRRDR